MSEVSFEHADQARAALQAIVTDPQHGVAALSSSQTMANLLKDLLPDAPREKSILVAAAEAGLAGTLRDHVAQGMDPATAIRLAASSFSASTPFTPDACAWVANELAIALGIVPASSRPPAGPGAAAAAPTSPPPGFAAGAQGLPTQVAPGGAGAPAGGTPLAGAPMGGPPAMGAGFAPGQLPTQGAGQPPPGPTGPMGGTPGAFGAWPGGAPAGYGQPGYGQPGGFGPGGFGTGQPPVRPPNRRRGLVIGGGAAAVVVLAVVLAVALSGGPGPKPRPTPGPTPGPTTSTPAPPPTVVEPLSTIMNPVGQAPVGSNCLSTANTNLNGLNPATVVEAHFCPGTFAPYDSNIHVFGYQFDNAAGYQAGLRHLNSYAGFDTGGRLSGSCPPPSGFGRGSTHWWANSNPLYTAHRPGQILECFTDHLKVGARALLIWTLPTQRVIFVGEDANSAGSGASAYLITWWKHVAYHT